MSEVSKWLEGLRSKDVVDTLTTWGTAAGLAYVVYWQVLGKTAARDRDDMRRRLIQAEQTVKDLEQRLASMEKDSANIPTTIKKGKGGNNKSTSVTAVTAVNAVNAVNSPNTTEKKEIRIWMDGAFDMFHYGHMNAFRQGRSLGTYLIAGVNSDATITACKGKPVCNEQERLDTVRGCKWVDEVVEGVPYIMNEEYLLYVIEKYRIDYIVHGDDPCIVDGKNVYETAVNLGKYLTIPRTEGISTTDIVGRMLMMTCSHHEKGSKTLSSTSSNMLVDMEYGSSANKLVGALGNIHQHHNSATDTDEDEHESFRQQQQLKRKSQFLTTSHKLRLFGAGVKPPTADQRVVYIAGAWDMFHAGHIETLEKAKKCGDYLIVGVHNDQDVNTRYGMNLPILSLHERVLSVLGCKWVDDVLIDAPYVINQEMISTLRINVVVQALPASLQGVAIPVVTDPDEEDPYVLSRQQNMLQQVYINYDISALDFVERIQSQRDRFETKFVKKMEQEKEFYKTKFGL